MPKYSYVIFKKKTFAMNKEFRGIYLDKPSIPLYMKRICEHRYNNNNNNNNITSRNCNYFT